MYFFRTHSVRFRLYSDCMKESTLNYERPTIVDHGSLTDLTAMLQVGGPVDTFQFHPPGHSCPTGGVGGNVPPCNGVGSAPGG
jgi:hypothetical protein